jgi:hypothetical protein
VPASEKIVSIFEPHTDIIVQDRRDTYYGHKVCLCVEASNFITDCVIAEGNPADTQLTLAMLDRRSGKRSDSLPLFFANPGSLKMPVYGWTLAKLHPSSDPPHCRLRHGIYTFANM